MKDYDGAADMCFTHQTDVRKHLLKEHHVGVRGAEQTSALHFYRVGFGFLAYWPKKAR